MADLRSSGRPAPGFRMALGAVACLTRVPRESGSPVGNAGTLRRTRLKHRRRLRPHARTTLQPRRARFVRRERGRAAVLFGRGEIEDEQVPGNLVVLCDLVGGQNGTNWTLLSCQTLKQSEASIRYLNVTWPLLKYKKNQGINLLLLSLFTISVSISAAVSCSTSAGRGVLQSAVLLPVSLTVLTIYTFWAASGGYDFIFLEPFAITSLVVAVVYLAEQAFVPLATVGTTAYGAGATIVFTAFLIFETKRIVKTHSSEEYVTGAITMYVDIMSLFMAQPTFK